MVPTALDEPVTATQRVDDPINDVTASTSRRPLSESNAAMRTVAPVSSLSSIHGDTLESWSNVVQTISSSGSRPRPMARVRAIMLAVVLGPNTMPPGSAPKSRPMTPLVRSTSASHSSAAENAP